MEKIEFLKLIDENENIFQTGDYKKAQKFLQDLEGVFAKHFGVPSCPVFIEEIKPTHTSFGRTPPACFTCSYHKKSFNKSNKETKILLNMDITQTYTYIKIVKLLMHEWMHYLSHYHLHIKPCEKIPEKYLQYVNLADNVKDLHIEKLENKHLAQALQKLSPSEFVADLFARDILRFIGTQSKNIDLRQDAQDKIAREEDMQLKFLKNINKICKTNYKTALEIEFEKIVKERKNVKTT